MTDYVATDGEDPSQYKQKNSPLFEAIIELILADIRSSTVLVIGGDGKALVETLRQQGVVAFGLNSEQAASPNEQHKLQLHYRVGSLSDPLSQQYDLIVCGEVLDHLPRSEAERVIENLCQHSQELLFWIKMPDEGRLADLKMPLPAYLIELLAHYGFFLDADLKAVSPNSWIAHFRKTNETKARIIAAYERRLWELEQENRRLRQQIEEQLAKLASQAQELLAWKTHWARIKGSMSWIVAEKLQRWRSRLSPPGSVREQVLEDLFQALRTRKIAILGRAGFRLGQEMTRQAQMTFWKLWLRIKPSSNSQVIQVAEVKSRPPLQPHQAAVDIIICVHNALADVQHCLVSVERHTTAPYSLILVDDGSDLETHTCLSEFADSRQNVVLLRNEQAQGYTKAANLGLSHASADFVVMLNSDTAVTAEWLDRLIACAQSDAQIGLVGPLSNIASWQSIPEIEVGGDWAVNQLPSGMTVAEMGRLVACYSARLYPSLPFLNGFCLLIRRQVIDELGLFDEANFGAGYGEENDYALRARHAGWRLALADDTYVYHAQSRSYSNERRKQLSQQASFVLAKKHGSRLISQGISFCRQDRVLNGIRARSRVMFARQEMIEQGRAGFQGRRLLFVLPIIGPSGGGNVIIYEAMAMRAMGVEVDIFNLVGHREGFEHNYPALDVPLIYGYKEDLVTLASRYDAVVATANFSVEWLFPISRQQKPPVLGYYVQEFEPYMYSPETEALRRAVASYSLLPNLICFTKTAWTSREVKKHTGVQCIEVGVSLNIDLLRPRPRSDDARPERPLKIVAMVRPRPAYRQAKLTMELLQRTSRHYGARVEIFIFGISLDDPEFAKLPRDFAWNLAGILTQRQVANLLNEADIFADFSSHQAMGLTALEAMACGSGVIVPARGGAVSFARHEKNSLVIDTASPETCWQALQRLVEDQELRTRLQQQALVDVCDYFPERSAFNILSTLFLPEDADNKS